MNEIPFAQTASRVRGVIAAIATPITPALAPDHDRFIALARKLLAGGCDGLNVLGTTGEATSFTLEQRMGVMSAAAKAGLPLKRLLVGTGAAALGDAVQLSRHAASLGFAGALVLPPFYYKGVSDAGTLATFAAITAATGSLPLYLYNFPALSGVPYTPALVRKLTNAFPGRIAGLKDSSGDHAYAREIAAISGDLDVFPSTEAILLEARGGPFAGCISATANLNAHYCAKAFRDGDGYALEKAVAIRKLFDGAPLVPGIKLLLADIHGDPALAAVMPPLVGYSDADAAKLRERYRAMA
jgi:4-hydroxy-tetrahydrodipicolinate synthase